TPSSWNPSSSSPSTSGSSTRSRRGVDRARGKPGERDPKAIAACNSRKRLGNLLELRSLLGPRRLHRRSLPEEKVEDRQREHCEERVARHPEDDHGRERL